MDTNADQKNTNAPQPEAPDTINSPRSEREMEQLQRNDVTASPAIGNDDDIDPDDVDVLPGTGGPDDQGDVDVSADDLNLGAILRTDPAPDAAEI